MSIIGSEGAGQSAQPTQSAGNPAAQNQAPEGQQTSWRDALPEDLRKNSAISQFKDLESFTKSYIHAQSMIGKKGVVVPTEQSAPEEWNDFFTKIGRPELEKFEVAKPEGSEISDEFLAKFKEMAHKNGLLPKQAKELLSFLHSSKSEEVTQMTQENERALTEQIDGLKKEWGDGWDKNIALAKMAVREAGGPELVKYLEETGLGNDVTLVKAFAKVGSFLGEDKLRGSGNTKFGKTPAEVEAEYEKVQAQLYSMDRTKNPNEYAILEKNMEQLAKQRWGE